MNALPAPLAGLANYPQFLTYILVPSRKPGKMAKLPMNPRTGEVCDAHDASAWTTADEALAAIAAGRGVGLAFTFTEADPYFFLDIDNALGADGQWSELARSLCAAFPGACVEVSSSGKGLHVIARGAQAADARHRKRNDALGLEFYTSERFIALTGTSAVGNVDADMSVVVPWLVEHYFPPHAAPEHGHAGTGPREDWRGPVDDDDLIRRALQSKSSAGVFGGKATFADLWHADEAALARAYPSDNGDAFNRSSADAALASHLAFWTGCDAERIERLMRRSGLARDKYDRADYLPQFTIPNAIANQRDVCRDKEVIAPSVAADPHAATAIEALPAGRVKAEAVFVNPAQQTEFFAGCVYVQDAHRIFTPSGAMLKQGQFRAWYGGHIFILDNSNDKTTRDAWEAFTESNAVVFPRAASSWFRPDLPPGGIVEHEGLTYLNTYLPLNIPRKAGDPAPFVEHVRKLLPDERDRAIVLAYMAACVQYPGVKFQWAPLLQGVEGNGKSLLSRCLAYTIGERYTHWPRADQISTKFNSWLVNRLLICVEDVYTPEHQGELLEALKPMITNSRQPVEPKGVDQQSLYVWCNFFLNSNHKDAIKKTRNDRRIAPFFTAQQQEADLERDGMRGDYFPRLYAWLRADGYAIVADFLASYPIPDELNPATNCHRAPRTTSTEHAIEASLGGVEQEVLEAVAQDKPGFCGNWISSFAFDALLEKMGRARSLTRRKREDVLAALGYVKHPALAGGRTNNPVLPDGGKPVLFVRVGTPEHRITSGAEVARAYSTAQGHATFGEAPAATAAAPPPPPSRPH